MAHVTTVEDYLERHHLAHEVVAQATGEAARKRPGDGGFGEIPASQRRAVDGVGARLVGQ